MIVSSDHFFDVFSRDVSINKREFHETEKLLLKKLFSGGHSYVSLENYGKVFCKKKKNKIKKKRKK
jgi:hypothetical protein